VEVNELLTIDYRDAQLLGLRRVKQHAFHFMLSRALHGQGKPYAVTIALCIEYSSCARHNFESTETDGQFTQRVCQ
ncbi:MAG: hypothetical protein ACREU0_11060, partial [Burkholderiales bacterium]